MNLLSTNYCMNTKINLIYTSIVLFYSTSLVVCVRKLVGLVGLLFDQFVQYFAGIIVSCFWRLALLSSLRQFSRKFGLSGNFRLSAEKPFQPAALVKNLAEGCTRHSAFNETKNNNKYKTQK